MTSTTSSTTMTLTTSLATMIPTTSTTVTFKKFSFSNIQNLFSSGSALLSEILSSYTSDLSGCLSSCSNKGECMLTLSQKFVCQCNSIYIVGTACQTDLRPCSNGPCLNNGTCINNNNLTGYVCECGNFYCGSNCEKRVNLCQISVNVLLGIRAKIVSSHRIV